MRNILSFFYRNLFWTGFLAGTIFWWLIILLRPLVGSLRNTIRSRLLEKKESEAGKLDRLLRNHLLKYLQQLHMANPIFSLEEILIGPSLMLPPRCVDLNESDIEDVTAVVPYMPDWPQMATVYGCPRLDILEAVSLGRPIAVIGKPGSGKTVALAYLAMRLIRDENIPINLRNKLPIWINAGTINPNTVGEATPLQVLLDSISGYFDKTLSKDLIKHVTQLCRDGKALLVVDGLDELPAVQLQPILAWIEAWKNEFSTTQMLVAARDDYFDGLILAGFVPLALTQWDNDQVLQFLDKWKTLWEKNIETEPRVDPTLLNAWLQNNPLPSTPLDLTLKIWALYTGDIVGPNIFDGIESYVERLLARIGNGRRYLEIGAFEALRNSKIVFSMKDLDDWVRAHDPELQPSSPQIDADSQKSTQKNLHKADPRSVVEEATERGFLVRYGKESYKFLHLTTHTYLASSKANDISQPFKELNKVNWVLNRVMHMYSCVRFNQSELMDILLQSVTEPLQESIIEAGYWLMVAPEDINWRSQVLRSLAGLINSEVYPLSLRAKAITALACSRSNAVNLFFKQLVDSSKPTQQILGALGYGLLRDHKAASDLILLLKSEDLNVQRAANLALVSIGNRASLEAVAGALLSGDDKLQQMSAEALANHPEEGHPTLQEGAQLEDVRVRRAVVYGLRRLKHTGWAASLLVKIRVEDEQWIVKDAAAMALDEDLSLDSRIYQKPPPAWQLPWLIAYAGEKGLGIAPGKAAHDLITECLHQGNEEQRIAALEYIRQSGELIDVAGIYSNLFLGQSALSEHAYMTLWQLSRTDNILPSPIQYGFQ